MSMSFKVVTQEVLETVLISGEPLACFATALNPNFLTAQGQPSCGLPSHLPHPGYNMSAQGGRRPTNVSPPSIWPLLWPHLFSSSSTVIYLKSLLKEGRVTHFLLELIQCLTHDWTVITRNTQTTSPVELQRPMHTFTHMTVTDAVRRPVRWITAGSGHSKNHFRLTKRSYLCLSDNKSYPLVILSYCQTQMEFPMYKN